MDLHLVGRHRIADALSHLYVLLPVLDGAKHYWVTSDEIDKLIRRGGAWLAGHPQQGLITRRYLAHRRQWVDDATDRLAALEDAPEPEELSDEDVAGALAVDAGGVEAFVPLIRSRKDAVLQALRDAAAARVVDLACGSGSLLVELLADHRFSDILGADVSARELERAASRLQLDRMADRSRSRITLIQSSLTYRDPRISGFDAAVLMEVIEHLDPERLPALERNVFAHARPAIVVVTTPNAEFNVRYDTLPKAEFRHSDHRFEWNRAQFSDWVSRVGSQYGYEVEVRSVGEPDPEVGSPTQLALFRRQGGGDTR